jgi:predicted nucleotidyltransferase
MDVARPYAAVSPTLDGEVLRVLAGTTMLQTGRQVAYLTGRSSHSGVLDALNRLTEHGLVTRVELNRAYLYALNTDHLAADAVIALAGLRAKLFERIKVELGTWRIAPVHVSLFGSTARGDGDTHSDIDLFIVRPETVPAEDPSWQEQLDELRDKIQRWTGNRAAMHEKSETELAQLQVEERPILAELRADAIALSGSDMTTLLETAA